MKPAEAMRIRKMLGASVINIVEARGRHGLPPIDSCKIKLHQDDGITIPPPPRRINAVETFEPWYATQARRNHILWCAFLLALGAGALITSLFL